MIYLPHRRKAFRGGGNDAYTKLLLHMDGTDDAQIFTDSSASAHTITANGNVKTESTEKKFGATSAYFDGTGDHLDIADSSDFKFDVDFTIDGWVKTTQDATGRILALGLNADKSIQIFSKGHVYYNSGYPWSNVLTDGVLSTGAWVHFAIVRSSNYLAYYINGVRIGDLISNSDSMVSSSLRIGNWLEDEGRPYAGYIDELRISKGIARWTANFTPPTVPYS